MPSELSQIHRFPCRRRVAPGTILLWLFLAVVVGRVILHAVQKPSSGSLVLVAISLFCTALGLALRFCKPDEPYAFYIAESRAGFGNPDRDRSAVDLHAVTECMESPSSLQLVHESISVPLGLELRRHDFALADWVSLTALMTERVRALSPQATVRTLLDPPAES
jgi:hypothetical protein